MGRGGHHLSRLHEKIFSSCCTFDEILLATMSKALFLACIVSVANALVATPAVMQARGRAVAPVKMVDPKGWCAPPPRTSSWKHLPVASHA